MKIEYTPVKLELKYPFGISREIKYSVTNVFVRLTYEYEGKIYHGYGEAAPSKFYGETSDSILAFYKWVEENKILECSPFDVYEVNTKLAKMGYNNAAKSAIDCAIYDLLGKIYNVPVYKYLGFNNKVPDTSFTIDISNIETTLKKTGEALMTGYDVFKVKLGTNMDEEIIFSIRQVAPESIIRVDANAAWDLKTALKMVKVLEKHNIEFIEQPLAYNNLKDLEILRKATYLPIIVDESITTASDLANLNGLVDGVNIKLSKCGGITNSLKILHTARSFGMKVMVGCFLETSLGIAAACNIATRADYVDLDGSLLLKTDPYNIIQFDCSKISIPNISGITPNHIFNDTFC